MKQDEKDGNNCFLRIQQAHSLTSESRYMYEIFFYKGGGDRNTEITEAANKSTCLKMGHVKKIEFRGCHCR